MRRACSRWCLLLLTASLLVLPLSAAADGPPGSVIAWGCHNLFPAPCAVPAGAATGVTAISSGGAHGLALKLDGSVIAWGCAGDSDWGQCAVPAAAAGGVTAISAGLGHSLAVKNGGVIAWGCKGDDIDSGQCTVPAAAKSGVTAVAAGSNHSLALRRARLPRPRERFLGPARRSRCERQLQGASEDGAHHVGRVVHADCLAAGQRELQGRRQRVADVLDRRRPLIRQRHRRT